MRLVAASQVDASAIRPPARDRAIDRRSRDRGQLLELASSRYPASTCRTSNAVCAPQRRVPAAYRNEILVIDQPLTLQSVPAVMNPNSHLVEQLPSGEHRLHDSDLRSAYGLSGVTASVRCEIARDLRQAGLQILSDPTNEPLVVRKTAPAHGRAISTVRPWWKRPWVITTAGVIALIMLVGALSDDDTSTKAANESPGVTSVGETTTARPKAEQQPAPTLTDAAEKVDQDHYAAALSIASELSDQDEGRIMQKISRRLATRTIDALQSGDRRRARFLLDRVDEYGSTPQSSDAWARYEAAQQRVAERRAAARQQREQQTAPAPSLAPESVPPPDTFRGPSTTNWCGKRDGDGDGIYCE